MNLTRSALEVQFANDRERLYSIEYCSKVAQSADVRPRGLDIARAALRNPEPVSRAAKDPSEQAAVQLQQLCGREVCNKPTHDGRLQGALPA